MLHIPPCVFPHMHALQADDGAGLRAWGLLRLMLLRLLWYCGLLAVPAASFAVGAAAYDALHGAYWAGLLLQLASSTLQLRPSLAMVGVVHALRLARQLCVRFPW